MRCKHKTKCHVCHKRKKPFELYETKNQHLVCYGCKEKYALKQRLKGVERTRKRRARLRTRELIEKQRIEKLRNLFLNQTIILRKG